MGEDVSGFGRDELARLRREAFGFVFQSYNLIGGASATENVEIPAIYAGMAPAERHARAKQLLSTLGLSDRLDHKPNQLSGGQQQRVSIARALMNGGQIILADEPTGALDSKSGVEVLALLNELSRKGHTVIVITHSQEVAAHAHRVIEIRDGVIVSDAGPRAADAAPAPQASRNGGRRIGFARARRSRKSRRPFAARQSFPHRAHAARHRHRRRLGDRDARGRRRREAGGRRPHQRHGHEPAADPARRGEPRRHGRQHRDHDARRRRSDRGAAQRARRGAGAGRQRHGALRQHRLPDAGDVDQRGVSARAQLAGRARHVLLARRRAQLCARSSCWADRR